MVFVEDVCLGLGEEVCDECVKFCPCLFEEGGGLIFLHHVECHLSEVEFELFDAFGASGSIWGYLLMMRS